MVAEARHAAHFAILQITERHARGLQKNAGSGISDREVRRRGLEREVVSGVQGGAHLPKNARPPAERILKNVVASGRTLVRIVRWINAALNCHRGRFAGKGLVAPQRIAST